MYCRIYFQWREHCLFGRYAEWHNIYLTFFLLPPPRLRCYCAGVASPLSMMSTASKKKETKWVFVQHKVFVFDANHFLSFSEVNTETQSFADCKLHIRTRLIASAFSNFWNPPLGDLHGYCWPGLHLMRLTRSRMCAWVIWWCWAVFGWGHMFELTRLPCS